MELCNFKSSSANRNRRRDTKRYSSPSASPFPEGSSASDQLGAEKETGLNRDPSSQQHQAACSSLCHRWRRASRLSATAPNPPPVHPARSQLLDLLGDTNCGRKSFTTPPPSPSPSSSSSLSHPIHPELKFGGQSVVQHSSTHPCLCHFEGIV